MKNWKEKFNNLVNDNLVGKSSFNGKGVLAKEGILKIKVFIFKLLKETYKETIICSAVKSEDGKIYRGHRHGDAMRVCSGTKIILPTGVCRQRKLWNGRSQQGFITSRNRYVLRKEARKLQEDAGIKSVDKDGYRHDTLFSEDLY